MFGKFRTRLKVILGLGVLAIAITLSYQNCAGIKSANNQNSLGGACTQLLPLESLSGSGPASKVAMEDPPDQYSQKVAATGYKFVSDFVSDVVGREDYEFNASAELTVKREESANCLGPLYRKIKIPNKKLLRDLEVEWAKDRCIAWVSNSSEFRLHSNPNDPLLSQQNYLQSTRVPLAWEIFYNSLQGAKENVILAILDEGVDAHPDIPLWKNKGEVPGNGVDDDKNGFVDDISGWNFVDSSSNSGPINSSFKHGTHVAGLAAAISNNSIGMAGVAGQHALVQSINIFGSRGTVDDATAAMGIRYAVDNGANVINMSWGGPGDVPAVKAEIARAISKKVLVVVSAGNEGKEISTNPSSPMYITPAAYTSNFVDGMLVVGGWDISSNRFYPFSNSGSAVVGILAPAIDGFDGLLSTLPQGQYGKLSGTSMAAPLVAGGALLVVSLAKSRNYKIEVEPIVRLIKSTGKSYPNLLKIVENGKVLDLGALAEAANQLLPVGGCP